MRSDLCRVCNRRTRVTTRRMPDGHYAKVCDDCAPAEPVPSGRVVVSHADRHRARVRRPM